MSSRNHTGQLWSNFVYFSQ